jgi:hypothetical protein
MALLPTRMACYFSQRYGLMWLDCQPGWLCAFVTPRITRCLLVLIACWAISGYCHSGRLPPCSGRSKPCRVCISIVKGCFFEQLSFSSSYGFDHSATDNVEVERPLRSIRLFRIVEGMTSTIRFLSVYSSIGSKICLDIICSSRT